MPGFLGLSSDPTDAERMGYSAFALAMNILRELRATGAISAESFQNIVENALVVGDPREGHPVEQHLYESLQPDRQRRQDERRGISRT